MGYRSNIVIAIRKEILAEDLISQVIPPVLKEEPHTVRENTVWWHLQDWKWYSSYSEIQLIERFFQGLSDREPLEIDGEKYAWFAAMRMGENDDDLQTWGEPYEFEIQLVRHLEFPGRE